MTAREFIDTFAENYKNCLDEELSFLVCDINDQCYELDITDYQESFEKGKWYPELCFDPKE